MVMILGMQTRPSRLGLLGSMATLWFYNMPYDRFKSVCYEYLLAYNKQYTFLECG